MAGQTTAQAGQGHKLVWDANRHGQQVKGYGLQTETYNFTGANAASFDVNLFSSRTYALGGEIRVLGAVLNADATVTGTGSGTAWGFYLRNIGAGGSGTATNLGTAWVALAAASGGSGLLATNAAVELNVNGPNNATPRRVFMDENEVLQFVASRLDGVTQSLAAVNFNLTVYLLNSPPGRSAFQQ